MTHYERPTPEAEDRMAASAIKRWEREEAERKKESEYRWEKYNSVKDLSHDWLPQERLMPEVKKMLTRGEAIFRKLPTLKGLTLKDSLSRAWEIGIDRGDDEGNVTEDGDIFMISARRSREESIIISLLQSESGAGVSYNLMFWPDSEDYGNPRNSEIALKLVKERFNDLFVPIEKSLGIKRG